eukprot:5860408-Amphidinium_carterae.1
MDAQKAFVNAPEPNPTAIGLSSARYKSIVMSSHSSLVEGAEAQVGGKAVIDGAKHKNMHGIEERPRARVKEAMVQPDDMSWYKTESVE